MLQSVAQRIGKARAKGTNVLKEASGYEPKVTIKQDGSFDVEYVRPEHCEDHHWGNDLHSEGNLYLEGFANPVAFDWESFDKQVDSGKVDSSWIPDERWRFWMRQDALESAMNTEGAQEEMLKKFMLALGGGMVFLMVMIAVALF